MLQAKNVFYFYRFILRALYCFDQLPIRAGFFFAGGENSLLADR